MWMSLCKVVQPCKGAGDAGDEGSGGEGGGVRERGRGDCGGNRGGLQGRRGSSPTFSPDPDLTPLGKSIIILYVLVSEPPASPRNKEGHLPLPDPLDWVQDAEECSQVCPWRGLRMCPASLKR